MQRALGPKNKFQFVDGYVEIPPHHNLNLLQWERYNYLIHPWLLNYVFEQNASTIICHVNTIDVWIDLKERFSKVDRIHLFSLRSSINTLKQDSKIVMDYFMEFKGLWKELNVHRPLAICSCVHQYRCLAMQNIQNYRHEYQVMQFLTGLMINSYLLEPKCCRWIPYHLLTRCIHWLFKRKAIINLFLMLKRIILCWLILLIEMIQNGNLKISRMHQGIVLSLTEMVT